MVPVPVPVELAKQTPFIAEPHALSYAQTNTNSMDMQPSLYTHKYPVGCWIIKLKFTFMIKERK